LLAGEEAPYRNILAKELAATKGFTAVAFGSWRRPKQILDRVELHYQRDQVSEPVGRHLDIVPAANGMYDLTTLEPMLYYWSNVLAFREYLPSLADTADPGSPLAGLNEQLQGSSGRSLEEFLDLLGNEISLVVESGAEDGGFFAIPQGLAFLRPTAPAELRRVLEELCIANDVQLTGQTYGPVEYVFWTPAPEDGLRPLYGFWGELFFFGNSSSLVKKLVDARQAGHSLLALPALRGNDPGLRQANNSVVYVDNLALIALTEKVLDLVRTIAAIEARETAAKVRVVIKDIVRPLLSGAKMYRAGISRSYFTPDRVVVESITTLAEGGE
jgi:hypothetical protein